MIVRPDPRAATTITGTTAITTANGFNKETHYQPTYTDSSAVAVTNASTLAVVGAPTTSGSATITNSSGIFVPTAVVAGVTNALRDCIERGESLRASDVGHLTPSHLANLKLRGDDYMRELIDNLERGRERQDDYDRTRER